MKRTQTARLLQHIRRRPHTMLELLMYGISTCPWKRLAGREVQPYLQEGERINRGKGPDGLVRWSTYRVAKDAQ